MFANAMLMSRRTQIVDHEDKQVLTASDLLPDEQVWIMVGEKGHRCAQHDAGDGAGAPKTGRAAGGFVESQHAGHHLLHCCQRPGGQYAGLPAAAGARVGRGQTLG